MCDYNGRIKIFFAASVVSENIEIFSDIEHWFFQQTNRHNAVCFYTIHIALAHIHVRVVAAAKSSAFIHFIFSANGFIHVFCVVF